MLLARRLTLCICAVLLLTACGSSSSPAAPSPSPTPPPTTATLSFQPSNAPGPYSFNFFDARESTAGQLALNVIANGFVGHGGFMKFEGTVLYDTRMLQFVSWSQGGFMTQDNTLATFTVYDQGSRGVAISVNRATSARYYAVGTGTVVVLRFKPARAGTLGSAPLQWTDAHAYTSSYDEQLYDAYGGTVSIR